MTISLSAVMWLLRPPTLLQSIDGSTSSGVASALHHSRGIPSGSPLSAAFGRSEEVSGGVRLTC